MKRILLALGCAILLLVSTVLVVSAQGPWTNGQNATYVIGQSDFTTSASGISSTKLNRPKDVAIDVDHDKLYVADRDNHRVLRFAYPITGNLPTAELVFGQPNFDTFVPGTTSNTLSSPYGVTIDSTGRLWVGDSANNRVVWFDEAHAISSNQPNADGVLGQPNFTTSTLTTTQSGMNLPYDLVVSSDGTLYVADMDNHRVLRFDDAASKANGADADGVLGQPTFITNTTANTPTQSGMNWPRGVALYGTTLFVTDRSNHRVLRFDNAASKANGANADGVLGQPTFVVSATSTTPTQSAIEYPSRVAVDEGGRLYVSDGFHYDRVVIFVDAVNKANGADADYVLGQPDFTSAGSATAQDRLSMDSSGGGVAVDSINNHLFVVDDANNRVMDFQASGELRKAILSIDKSGPSSVRAGNPITYTLTVTNSGPVSADRVVITDALPAGATYVSGGTWMPEVVGTGLMPGGVVSWTVGSLTSGGGTAQVQFVVTATQAITNSDYRVTSGEGVEAISAAGDPVVTIPPWLYYLLHIIVSNE